MTSPLLLGPEEWVGCNGLVRITGITLPLPSGSTGGNSAASPVSVGGGGPACGPAAPAPGPAAPAPGAAAPAPGFISVMKKFRILVKVLVGISNGNLFLSNRPLSSVSKANASSIGTCTPSTLITGQLRRIPDAAMGNPEALIASFDFKRLTSVPTGTVTVHTSQIEV